MSRPLLSLVLALALLVCCDDGPPVSSSTDDGRPDVVDTTAVDPADAATDTPERAQEPDTTSGVEDTEPAVEVTEPGPEPIDDPPPMVIGSWNLKNFSPYGVNDFRLEDLATKIEQLAPDVLAVQEIKVKEGSEGEGTQAWDALLERLDGYEGLVNPYNPMDSVVGLLYDPSVVSVVAWKTLFAGEWWPFPRAPIEATLRLTRDGQQITFKVIVLHLKAFPEGRERRREACEDLDAYLQSGSPQTAIVIGDFNDDPGDKGEANVFDTSFLGQEPTYDFVTAAMPTGTVTSLGYHHLVDGIVVPGEFLDHGVVTERLVLSYGEIEPEVVSRPPEDYDWYEDTYSDHFPVLLHFTP
ncbi:MAG: endonuclease/exonuclease/phosphatase family protein [Myxococcota bacterium]|jgi:endonuclease/exonuclease/phosphatase family metal-dependent hydrolase|nr:endonuclease/exonuclease/phosphatase family protein [Myxococcota bacterium]